MSVSWTHDRYPSFTYAADGATTLTAEARRAGSWLPVVAALAAGLAAGLGLGLALIPAQPERIIVPIDRPYEPSVEIEPGVKV